jgi:O-antigen/teichoic acid export membrane protein
MSSRRGMIERLLTIAWSGIENSCRQALSLAFFFVSVRFLQPSDLGVFALTSALGNVTLIFIDDMIGEALVQKADVTERDWDTGFTLNLILAVGFLVLSLAVSWPLARLLAEPPLQFALPVMSLFTVIGALGNVQKAFLSRALRFRVIAQTTLTGQVVGGVAGVTFAALGFRYWALIAGVAITTTVCSALFWWSSPWKPKLKMDRSTVQSRLSYLANVAAIRAIYQLRDQSPLIIAGLVIDLTHVGLLSLALRVARSLGQLLEEVTTRPLLSLVSREQHDIALFGEVLLQVIVTISAIALPGYIGLAVVGPSLLSRAFGQSWELAGLFLPWLCVVLGSWLMLHIVAVSLRARSLGHVAVMLTATATITDLILLVALTPLGLKWMLIGWAARSALSIPVAIYTLQTRLGVRARTLMVRCAPMLLAALVMVGTLEFFDRLYGLANNYNGLIIVVAPAAIYLVCLGMVTAAFAGPSVAMHRALSVFKTGRRSICGRL